jgi:hypothetical protein
VKRPSGLLWVLCGALGCGNLSTTSEGVSFLEVQPPSSTTLHVGDTVQFTARTLDASGEPITVNVLWRTPDTTITVGPSTGTVIGRFTGTGRVQAVVGDEELVSDFITLTITAAPTPTPPP